jgi:polysaccharide biosynthesis protein VpsM
VFTESRDRDDASFAGAFFWRLAPKTSALLRAEYGTFDYDVATLDGTEKHLFVGIELDATARTSGRILFGRASKSFDDPSREDFSGTSWRASVTWKPRSYSIFDLSTGRDTDETNGDGDYILREDLTLGWAHNWTERFRTTVDAGVAQEEHRPSLRSDDVRYLGLSADYLFRPWLRFGASVKRYDRDSNIAELDYLRNVWLLSAEFTRR